LRGHCNKAKKDAWGKEKKSLPKGVIVRIGGKVGILGKRKTFSFEKGSPTVCISKKGKKKGRPAEPFSKGGRAVRSCRGKRGEGVLKRRKTAP